MENTEEKKVVNEEIQTAGKTQKSDLWKKEDWLACWIGFILIIIGSLFVHFDWHANVGDGKIDFNALKFSTYTVWENGNLDNKRSAVSDKKVEAYAKENIEAGRVDPTIATINEEGKIVDADGKVMKAKQIKKNKELVTDEQVANTNTGLLHQLNGAFWLRALITLVVLLILFTIGARLMGKDVKKYIPAFIGLFIIAIIVRCISAEFTLNRYLEWAFWALLVGLLISNTVGTPKWLKPAVMTEFYIKTGLVIMGFSVLFSNIAKFGLYGLGIAWIVTPIVIIFMWWLGTKIFKIENKPMVITLATATSVCGTSAAIATGAAAKAKKTDVSLAVSISIIFTVLMMVFEPIIIKAVGMNPVAGGSLIGGTVDSTGAVALAGNALGGEAEQAAVLVKSIQNILIGFIAFFVAIFFATRVEKNSDGSKVGAAEIWYRFPKFIIGFFVASLVASFLLPACGIETSEIGAINKVLDQYKNWAFVLAFTSIGLDTNFKEIKQQMQGGKVLWLYIIGQCFNILLTWGVIELLFGIFGIPSLATYL